MSPFITRPVIFNNVFGVLPAGVLKLFAIRLISPHNKKRHREPLAEHTATTRSFGSPSMELAGFHSGLGSTFGVGLGRFQPSTPGYQTYPPKRPRSQWQRRRRLTRLNRRSPRGGARHE